MRGAALAILCVGGGRSSLPSSPGPQTVGPARDRQPARPARALRAQRCRPDRSAVGETTLDRNTACRCRSPPARPGPGGPLSIFGGRRPGPAAVRRRAPGAADATSLASMRCLQSSSVTRCGTDSRREWGCPGALGAPPATRTLRVAAGRGGRCGRLAAGPGGVGHGHAAAGSESLRVTDSLPVAVTATVTVAAESPEPAAAAATPTRRPAQGVNFRQAGIMPGPGAGAARRAFSRRTRRPAGAVLDSDSAAGGRRRQARRRLSPCRARTVAARFGLGQPASAGALTPAPRTPRAP